MRAQELIDALGRKLGTASQTELAAALGVTVQTLINWKNRDEDLTPNQVASAIAKSRTSAVKQSQYETIQPIVEFYKIRVVPSRRDASWQVLDGSQDDTQYARELREHLDSMSGIYIFYDSRGRSLYVGKARQQTLWKEINLAFNRQREVQKLALANHPKRNQSFKPGYEKLRTIKDIQLELFDIATYFSAYSVEDGMIDDLEALLVRGFANDLLNVRMETFVHSRK